MMLNADQFRQRTSTEVSEMSDQEALETRHSTADYQRAVPEATMRKVQTATRGGAFSHGVEHIGDFSHRMNQGMSDNNIKKLEIDAKIGSGLLAVAGTNSRSIGSLDGRDGGEVQSEVNRLGNQLADEHRATPVYNYPTEVAVNAASSFADGNMPRARRNLELLSDMETGSSGYAEGDRSALLSMPRSGTPEHKQSMIDYLRNKEANTPAITDAATVMLGGRIKRTT
jgi:hypothetical protein